MLVDYGYLMIEDKNRMSMDGDSIKDDKQSKVIERKDSNNLPFPLQFFSTIWLRWSVRGNNEMDRFLLDYGLNFLPYIGIILYSVFIITKIL